MVERVSPFRATSRYFTWANGVPSATTSGTWRRPGSPANRWASPASSRPPTARSSDTRYQKCGWTTSTATARKRKSKTAGKHLGFTHQKKSGSPGTMPHLHCIFCVPNFPSSLGNLVHFFSECVRFFSDFWPILGYFRAEKDPPAILAVCMYGLSLFFELGIIFVHERCMFMAHGCLLLGLTVGASTTANARKPPASDVMNASLRRPRPLRPRRPSPKRPSDTPTRKNFKSVSPGGG